MTHPEPKTELLEDLRFTRGLCDEHDQTLSRALDCAIAGARRLEKFKQGECLAHGAVDCPKCCKATQALAAMTAAWEGSK